MYGSCARGNYDNESDIDVMIMVDMSREEPVNYRIEKVYKCLESAILLKDTGDYTSSVNRSYYSILHAIVIATR